MNKKLNKNIIWVDYAKSIGIFLSIDYFVKATLEKHFHVVLEKINYGKKEIKNG